MCSLMNATTTYKHDFVEPKIKRIKSEENKNYMDNAKSDDKKIPNKKLSPLCKCQSKLTETKNNQSLNDVNKCAKTEWTGIAPMGALIKPRIIPMDNQKVENETKTCFDKKPNKFLEKLPQKYPKLYEELKKTSNDELNRKTCENGMKSTYQIDYCGIQENVGGIYSENVNPSMDTINSSKPKYYICDPCAIYRGCDENYKNTKRPPLINRNIPTVRFPIVASISKNPRSHRSGKIGKFNIKKPNFSEYKDTTSRIGEIIMKQQIHDHGKCNNGKNCKHEFLAQL